MRRDMAWAELRDGRRVRRLRRRRPVGAGLGVGCERLERRDCPAAMFSIEPPARAIVEGDRATFTVRLSEPSNTRERIVISTVSETARMGADYVFLNGQQLVFAPGITSRQFSINTLQDSVREGIETLRVIATPMNRPMSQQMVAQVAIYDRVATSVSVAGDVRVVESNSGTKNADFTVRLTAGSLLPVTVQYATQNGTATAGSDYTATSGTLTFAPGELEKTVSVPILGDLIAERDETFRVLLSNPSRGTTIRTPQLTCTIVNDEVNAPGFQVTLNYVTPNLTDVQKSPFEGAKARLEQIIAGDLPSVTTGGGEFIDDIKVNVYVEAFTGPFAGANGFASATAFRTGNAGLPYEGEIHVNANRVNNPGMLYTVIHEIVHALGFDSNFFTKTGTASGLGSSAPLFTGANAVREYRHYFGGSATGVPLYASTSPAGNYGSHWETGVFGTEILSVGWDTNSTSVRPFSRITIGALDDIGYDVNYAAADSYKGKTDDPADVAMAQLAVATGVTTVSASLAVPSLTTSKTPSSSTVQAKPPVVVVQPASVVATTGSSFDTAPAVSVAGGPTVAFNVVPPKLGNAVTLLSRSGARMG